MEMFDHESDSFGEYAQESGPVMTLALPGETLIVNGPRLTPLIITISNKAERSPKRDARLLSAYLSCSLDETTIYHLAEYLFAEHLAPMMSDPRSLINLMQPTSAIPKKPQPKKRPNKEENDSKD